MQPNAQGNSPNSSVDSTSPAPDSELQMEYSRSRHLRVAPVPRRAARRSLRMAHSPSTSSSHRFHPYARVASRRAAKCRLESSTRSSFVPQGHQAHGCSGNSFVAILSDATHTRARSPTTKQAEEFLQRESPLCGVQLPSKVGLNDSQDDSGCLADLDQDSSQQSQDTDVSCTVCQSPVPHHPPSIKPQYLQAKRQQSRLVAPASSLAMLRQRLSFEDEE